MSKPCNRCRLNDARDAAHSNGLIVTIVPEAHEGWDRGLGIYAHPVKERYDSNPKFKVAWLASVTDLCVCGGRGG